MKIVLKLKRKQLFLSLFYIFLLFSFRLNANTCKALFGKSQIETIEDKSKQYRKIVLDNQNIKLEEVPIINYEQLKEINSIKVDGKGNDGAIIANLGNKKVFVKISNFQNENVNFFSKRSINHVINEIRFSIILHKIGLGPKFYGLVQFPNGKLGLVYENITGNSVQLYESYFSLTENQRKKLLLYEYILNAAGIRPRDFAFIAHSNGNDIYVIDTEFYQIVEPFNPWISFSFYANKKGISEELD
jgi:hypothetical protein